MMFRKMSDFTGLYNLSKTLRFELKPVGETAANLENSGLLSQDEDRQKYYPEMKEHLDEQHKRLLERVLKDVPASLGKLDKSELQKKATLLNAELSNIDWHPLYNAFEAVRKDNNSDTAKKLEDLQGSYRNLLTKLFATDEKYKLLTEATPANYLKTMKGNMPPALFGECAPSRNPGNVKKLVDTFSRFACYFTGFQKNRKNIYAEYAKATSAANRAINENFGKFYDGVQIFHHIAESYPEIIEQAQKELAKVLEDKPLASFFEIEAYGGFLAQSGITKYNNLLGGYTTDSNDKIRGINEFINLYRQQHTDASSDRQLCPLPPLFKQILSDRESISSIPEMFVNDKELKTAILDFTENELDNFEYNGKKCLMNLLKELLSGITFTSDLRVVAAELTRISAELCGSWSVIKSAIEDYAQNIFASKTEQESFCAKRCYTFDELNNLSLCNSSGVEVKVADFWSGDHLNKPFEAYIAARTAVWPVLNGDAPLSDTPEAMDKIKSYLDSVQEILHFVKPLIVKSEDGGDIGFYSTLRELYARLEKIIPLYNRVRNYATRKVGDNVKKMKLMFGCPTLADGWPDETANAAVILRNNEFYYLGILPPKSRNVFRTSDLPSGNCGKFKKMFYLQMADPGKDVQNLMVIDGKTVKKNGRKDQDGINKQLEELKNCYLPPEINRIRKSKSYSISEQNFCKNDLIKFIEYYMERVREYNPEYVFAFQPAGEYSSFKDFTDHVNAQAYQLSFKDVSDEYIENLVKTGKLFLFQIYNKDFAANATGRPNKHTLFWKALFDPENLRNVVFKLNGQAELFLRPPAIKKPTVHRVGEKMVNRMMKDGKPIPEKLYGEIFAYANGRIATLSLDAQSLLDRGVVTIKDVSHEIIKDRRYTETKYLFHVPLCINFKSPDKPKTPMNMLVAKCIKDNPNINIIGIDRGERNLIYITLIDQCGKILLQKSFNTVTSQSFNGPRDFDYHAKLNQVEHDRDAARKNWSTIGKIKDLKEGYLSQVVHEICRLMVEYNAIVVLENLNSGFKRGRFAVEKQVYQKFERALIEKCNYLVFKDVEKSEEPGNVLKGYQLTDKFVSFEKLGGQSGFLFYVPASYTSKIDPTTGFANLFDMRRYSSPELKREFFQKFEEIRYDAERDAFVFIFDYNKFNVRQKCSKTRWEVYSATERIVYNRNNRQEERVNPTEKIKELLVQARKSLTSNLDLKEVIKNLVPGSRAEQSFLAGLFYAFEKTLQMRNSSTATGEDYIQSPVLNGDGKFFDTHSSDRDPALPLDADANGAYHIALKGLYLLKNTISDDGKIIRNISNENWFDFMQNHRF